ncbi:putative Late nodulin [Medicago truncatula]|nr:putative Late nodulin [Medicago truncatula]
MVKIAKFLYVLIISLSLFLFAITVDGAYVTRFWCYRDLDCRKDMCKPPFNPRCHNHICICRLWGL